MKKYTNKILVTAGILLILSFVITFFLVLRELKNNEKFKTHKEQGIYGTHTETIRVDENGNVEVIEEDTVK